MKRNLVSLLLVAPFLLAAACATTQTGVTTRPAEGPDPRVGLRPGTTDPGVAAWNMRLVSNTPPPAVAIQPDGIPYTNSDLAFKGRYVIQGNYHGPIIWDVSNPARPTIVVAMDCPASQNDVSVYGDLLFVSVEAPSGRIDCGGQGVQDSVSAERMRGVRIFDIRDIAHPRLVNNVQTCRGSHTHTVVPDPNDPAHVYIYVSGSAPVRSPSELPGCSGRAPDADPTSVLFNIEIIQVPLAAPERARVIGRAPFLSGLAPQPRHAADTTGVGPTASTGPNQCHDITVYPAIQRGGGACGGYGILLDITDVTRPTRMDAVSDPNFSYWHSATFNNDGTKILFSDEWGGGGQPRCRATDRPEWGANAIFTVDGGSMTMRSYYKLPAVQTDVENCVAHNGSLIPVPGRDIMVQGWYQGGVSVFDWTDPDRPVEIAFFDRGPYDPDRITSAGSWSAYWYNGLVYSSEIARGLDVFELTPNEHLSRNEIEAAKLVRFDELNVQSQPRFTWPASFVVARAYLDQLERSRGLDAGRIAAARSELDRAERMTGDRRHEELTRLVSELESGAQAAGDEARVRALAASVRELAAQR